MSTLLLELHGNRELNHTIWPPHLYIYNDLLIYKKRKFFRLFENTISYSHIVRVNLTRGIFFANLEIITSADENVIVKFIGKKRAMKAKKLIDQKIYGALAKHQEAPSEQKSSSLEYEKGLSRLKELLTKGQLSKREFERKRADLLKKIR